MIQTTLHSLLTPGLVYANLLHRELVQTNIEPGIRRHRLPRFARTHQPDAAPPRRPPSTAEAIGDEHSHHQRRPSGAAQEEVGIRIPGFAQLQRLGKSLMLPIALLPAAGILLRLGQPDLLGGIETPVIGPFFDAMSAAGGAVFSHLPLLFAVGVAIGFAKKADGSTALSAVAGYLVIEAVFKHHVAGGPGGRRDDQLQRLRRHPDRSDHRGAVRPVPQHPIAGLSRVLRRSPFRPDRGVRRQAWCWASR